MKRPPKRQRIALPPEVEKWLDTRRAKFRYALLSKKITVEQWCAAHSVTHTHLNYILRGQRESDRIDALVYNEIKETTNPEDAAPFKPETK